MDNITNDSVDSKPSIQNFSDITLNDADIEKASNFKSNFFGEETKSNDVQKQTKTEVKPEEKVETKTEEKPEEKASPENKNLVVKIPYTLEEMANLDVDEIDTSRIPPEGQPLYKSMLRIVTRKSQKLSDELRAIEKQKIEIEKWKLQSEALKMQEAHRQREIEQASKIAEEEELLTPEEKNIRHELRELRKVVAAQENFRKQQEELVYRTQLEANARAIEKEWQDTRAAVNLPDDAGIRDTLFGRLFIQWQLDEKENRELTPMSQVARQLSEELGFSNEDRFKAIFGNNTYTQKWKEQIERDAVAAYLKEKTGGNTTINSNSSTVSSKPPVESSVKSFEDVRTLINNELQNL